MAHLIKKSKLNNRGIIVFTDKEWSFFTNSNLLNKIRSLKKKYFLGFNTGGYHGKTKLPEEVDFVFGNERFISFESDKILRLPYSDSNFVSKEFFDMGISERFYDICCVNSISKLKRTAELLKEIKKVFKLKMINCLLVLTTGKHNNSTYQDLNILKLWDYIFTEEEKNYISIIYLSKKMSRFHGIPKKSLNWFLNNSKIFYAGSDYEGANRTSKEALLAGCKILYYKYSKSGISIGLNDLNSKSFEDYNDISQEITFLLKKYKYKEVSSNDVYKFSENYTSEKLLPYFRKLHEEAGEEYDGELINLDNFSNRLASHYLNVPWYVKNSGSSDIFSDDQLNYFISYLKGNKFKFKTKHKNLNKKIDVPNKKKFKYFLLQIRDFFRRKYYKYYK